MKERFFLKKSKDEIALKEFIKQYFVHAKCGDIEVQQTPLGTRIVIYTVSPGLVIGSGGDRIRDITEKLKKEHGIENPQIDVQKINNPNLNSSIVAQSIAEAIEKKVNFKKVANYYLEKVIHAGAVGCEIVISGKISGEKSRKERFISGYVKKAGEPAETDVESGRAIANPPLGIISINVKIMHEHSDEKIKVIKRDKTISTVSPKTDVVETTEPNKVAEEITSSETIEHPNEPSEQGL